MFYNTRVIRKRKLEPHPGKLEYIIKSNRVKQSQGKYNAIINHTTVPLTPPPYQEKTCFSLDLIYYA